VDAQVAGIEIEERAPAGERGFAVL
jgi:hypothetical protein